MDAKDKWLAMLWIGRLLVVIGLVLLLFNLPQTIVALTEDELTLRATNRMLSNSESVLLGIILTGIGCLILIRLKLIKSREDS